MVSIEKKLKEILRKIELPHSSIKELSELYFEAKKDIFGGEELGTTEGLIAVNIFLQGYSSTYEYCSSKGVGNLTDEDLDLLPILCDEASVNFEYLTEALHIFTKEESEEKQKQIKICRESVLREKSERKVKQNSNFRNNENNNYENEENSLLKESLQRRIDELQKRVDYLRSKNKKDEVNNLQKRIDEIKAKDNPTDNPTKDKNSFFLGSFFIGSGVVLVAIVIFLVVFNINKTRKKIEKRK